MTAKCIRIITGRPVNQLQQLTITRGNHRLVHAQGGVMQTEQHRIVRGIALFVIPIIGACLPPAFVDLLVPRELNYAIRLTESIVGPISFGANVAASFYYVAISGAITLVVCAISIWCCTHWLLTTGQKEAGPVERKWIWVGIAVAVLFPLCLLGLQNLMPDGCNRLAIDDCMTKTLFAKTIRKVYSPSFAMNQDANFLAYIVFTSYLLALATISTAASSLHGARHGTESAKRAKDRLQDAASERAVILNMVLFLTAAVLVAAMITAKFRFDVGLATLGLAPTEKVPNPSFAAYQTIASAIMTYWASVLSLCLALIYLPSAYVLRQYQTDNTGSELASFFSLNRENGMRFLKLAAIVSPPLINKLVETFATLPKGV